MFQGTPTEDVGVRWTMMLLSYLYFEGPYRTKVIFMHFTGQFPRDLPRNVKKFEEETHLLESSKILKDLATSCKGSVICPFNPNFLQWVLW
jgi:hypothetical protein